jgi:hypothetical protein
LPPDYRALAEHWERRARYYQEIVEKIMADDEFEVSVTHTVTGFPDGDYTDDFVEAGTTMSVNGAMQSDPIPIERAVIKDGKLTLTGYATFAQQ